MLMSNYNIKISTQNSIIYLLLFISISMSKANTSFFQKDMLSRKVEKIVYNLDSISKDNEINLNPHTYKFDLFLLLIKTASDKELLHLANSHPNSVVRGYAYIGLVLLGNKNADKAIKKNYKALTVLVADVGLTCKSSDGFIEEIRSKKNRLLRVIKNSENLTIDELEKQAIEDENKIRQEQGIPLRTIPK